MLLHSSYLPLGVSQRVAIKQFSGAVAGEKKRFCKGSLSFPISLLCYCFACFILLYFVWFVLSKIQKKLVCIIAFIFVVLCAGSMLLLTPVVRPAKSQPATPSEVTCFSYWSIKPWFLTEGNLLLHSSYLPLGVSQHVAINRPKPNSQIIIKTIY